MKKFLALVGLFLLAALPMGCSKSDENTIRVADFLTDPVLIQIINDTLHDIEKQNPGLKIKLETTPYNDYQQKVTTQMSAGNAPDILFVEVNNFVDLYLRGGLEDLEPCGTKDQMHLKPYYPSVGHRSTPHAHPLPPPHHPPPPPLTHY